jgi:tRNA dimethylallyltransferase
VKSKPSSTIEPFYLVGATASGKSALAMALAEHVDGEIVNADAFQLYRGMDICTAQPSPEDLRRVPHHLYGVIDPRETSDAQRYCEMAQPVIRDIAERGKVPLIVSGSGLYVKALTHGLSPLPNDPGLRARLEHLTAGERVSWLLHRDPGAAQTVNLKNDRYVMRALEICLLTGERQSELRKAWSQAAPEYRGVRLVWDREALAARIQQRVRKMAEAGLVAEIAGLNGLSATAEKAIGVREIRAHLAGEGTLEQALDSIALATRQYARRQDKWFRREKGFVPLAIANGQPIDELVERVWASFPDLR